MQHAHSAPHTLVRGAFLLVLILGFGFVQHTAGAATHTTLEDAVVMTASGIIDETNEARVAHGYTPLATSTALMASAQRKAEDMVTRSYFDHTTPDGARFWTFIDAVSYPYAHAGENLGVHFSTAEGLVDAWLNSPTHRANLLDPQFDEIGIGLAYGTHNGTEGWFIVQHFGSVNY